MLDGLPMEIVEAIIDLLTDKQDLKRLCEVSKRLYEITVPKLYDTIVIQPQDELYLERLNVESFLRTCSNPINCLQFVKNIHIVAPFHRNLKDRCLHDRFHEEDDYCWFRCPFHGKIETQPKLEKDKKPEKGKKSEKDTKSSDHKKSSSGKKLGRESDDSDDENDDSSVIEETDDHSHDEDDIDDNEVDYHGVFQALEESLLPLFQNLKDNHLRTLRWDLGTCVPFELLGPKGYLPEKQNRIESLTLTTAGMCGANMEGFDPLELSNMKTLRSFSWTAPRSAEDFEALRDVLFANSDHLEKLYLDLVDWPEADDSWYIGRGQWNGGRSLNFFSQDVLEISSSRDEERKVLFPMLRDLALSAVSFRSVPKKLAYAFNFSGLRSLRLRNCPCIRSLLRVLTDNNLFNKLTCLELVMDDEFWEDVVDPVTDPVRNFLESFEGLEELSLVITDPMGIEEDYWRPVFHHQPTLKRLIYHERTIDVDEDSATFELIRDNEMIEGNCGEYGSFNKLTLECIGLSGNASLMKTSIQPLASKQTLKLLHLRRTGSDMTDNFSPDAFCDGAWDADDSYSTNYERMRDLSDRGPGHTSTARIKRFPPALAEFAQWAFGPQGYPELQVLAYGDFSYEGRYERYNLLLCRREIDSPSSTSPDTGTDTESATPLPSEQPTKETTTQPPNIFDKMMTTQRVRDLCEKGEKSPAKSELTFRMMSKEDERELLDGINAIKGAREFLAACPIDPVLE